MSSPRQRSRCLPPFLSLILASSVSLFLAAQFWSRASAGGVDGAPLRPGTVTVMTFSRLRAFSSDIDLSRAFDLDARSYPFETYAGVHPPRVYRARWEGWTPAGWHKYSAEFEVNGPTVIVPIWRADGTARIVYVADHISERRYWP